jgi:hypothetical protein
MRQQQPEVEEDIDKMEPWHIANGKKRYSIWFLHYFQESQFIFCLVGLAVLFIVDIILLPMHLEE